MATVYNSKFINIMFRSTGVNLYAPTRQICESQQKANGGSEADTNPETGTGGGTYSKCGESQESIVQQWRRSRFRASKGPERRRGQAGD